MLHNAFLPALTFILKFYPVSEMPDFLLLLTGTKQICTTTHLVFRKQMTGSGFFDCKLKFSIKIHPLNITL